jgi:hypothetical protein
MWLVRLLPGMGPPTETPKTGTGKNKIRIKPSTTLPPANVNAKTIGEFFDGSEIDSFLPNHVWAIAVNCQVAVSAHREAISEFHRACGGRVDYIHALFCSIAEHNGKPPMPPNIMAAMLDLTPVSESRIKIVGNHNRFKPSQCQIHSLISNYTGRYEGQSLHCL